ncbi:hypothetical protein AC579_8322 [Pseudocercospora musae]|uniref:Uncharacterized protein n=1 Tax=Pseudocercospora musae TaxID=113226 RepID=A0A139HIR8_9PEZI|nr:hypothetical protein AC579_8322 [Pseudocercospora musae]
MLCIPTHPPSPAGSLLDSDRFGQISWEVDVQAFSDSQPVGHELEWDDVEETLEDVDGVWDFDLVGLVAWELLVVGVADDDWASLACNDLLVGVERLGEDVVAGEDHDDWEILVDKRKNTVLQLTRHDSLAVEVGNLLDLEGSLESSRVLSATSKQKEGLLVLELEAELLDFLVHLENFAELLRNLAQTLHNLETSLLFARAILGEKEGEHDHADELRGICFGGCDTNLWARVDVDTAVGHERDGGTDDVDNTDRQGAALQAVAQSHERVGSLTGLRDEDAGVVTEDRGLAVQEIRSKLDGDGDLRDEDETSAATDCADVLLETAQSHSLVGQVQATAHGVDHGLRLLEDLLLHEVVEAALHDLLELNLQSLDGANIAGAIRLAQTVNVELTLVNVGNIVVFEVKHLLGVLDDGGGVGGEEEFGGLWDAIVGEESARLRAVEEGLVWWREEVAAKHVRALLQRNILAGLLGGEHVLAVAKLNINKVNLHLLGGAHTNDERRTLPGGHNLAWEVDTLHKQTEGTLQLLDDSLDQSCEVDGWVRVVDVFCELRDGLSVGLRLEFESLALQQSLQLLVVGDDAIVHDGKLPLGVGSVRMAVDSGWRTVGGPSGVCDSCVVVEKLGEIWLLLVDQLLELGNLAHLFEGEDLILPVAIDGQTGGVIATVFESAL